MSQLSAIQDAIINKFPHLYCLKHRFIKGKPLTFYSKTDPRKHRPWQIAILNDQHPNKVVRKSRQLGLSEMAISEFVWFLDTNQGTKAMYTFPRKEQMEDFSNTRVTTIFQESPYLSTRLDTRMNNVRLKKIGNSFLLLRSAWGSALGEGADIDILGLDEYDRMKDNVELAFQEGLKSSKYGYMRRWSTPTIPGRGVDLLFSKSDQNYLYHTCDHCNEKQILSLEDNIMQIDPNGVDMLTESIKDGTYELVCNKCHKPLNRWKNDQIWVPHFPDRTEIRAYHISQLDAAWISADTIMRNQFQYKAKQLFYNYVIGIAYASEGLLITDQDVLSCISYDEPIGYRDYSMYKKVVAGIDWGWINWIVILGLREDNTVDILNIDWIEDNPNKPLECVEYFVAILGPYDPDFIVPDAGFGADRNTYLIQKFPGRVYACDWDTPKSNIPLVDSWSDNTCKVRVDKTIKMKRTLYNIKARAIRVFGQGEKLNMLIKHLKNVRTLLEEDDGEIYERVTRIGADHTACALTYAYIALDRILDLHKPKNDFSFDFM